MCLLVSVSSVLMLGWRSVVSECCWMAAGSMAAFFCGRFMRSAGGERQKGRRKAECRFISVCVCVCDYSPAQWAHFCRASGRAWRLWLKLFSCF